MEIPSKAAKTQGLKGILYFKTVKDGIIISHQANNVKHLFLFFQKNFTPGQSLVFIDFFQNIILIFTYQYQIYLISNQYISSNTPHILYLHRHETPHQI